MIMYHLGQQLGVWIIQVSTFGVLINRFHCKAVCHQCISTFHGVFVFQGIPAYTKFSLNMVTADLICNYANY